MSIVEELVETVKQLAAGQAVAGAATSLGSCRAMRTRGPSGPSVQGVFSAPWSICTVTSPRKTSPRHAAKCGAVSRRDVEL